MAVVARQCCRNAAYLFQDLSQAQSRLVCTSLTHLFTCAQAQQHACTPLLTKYAVCLQRICDDVPAFTYGSTKLIMSAVRQLLNCIVFAGKHRSTETLLSSANAAHVHRLRSPAHLT